MEMTSTTTTTTTTSTTSMSSYTAAVSHSPEYSIAVTSTTYVPVVTTTASAYVKPTDIYANDAAAIIAGGIGALGVALAL
ncbi:UNVERIFIED_CONTAM: hypothetical protein HDU68_000934 [Siphonaria sp. JEL0065]|nr:hypothetical protein HDU68_000934 [Siphonaria sp. JEL0065]